VDATDAGKAPPMSRSCRGRPVYQFGGSGQPSDDPLQRGKSGFSFSRLHELRRVAPCRVISARTAALASVSRWNWTARDAGGPGTAVHEHDLEFFGFKEDQCERVKEQLVAVQPQSIRPHMLKRRRTKSDRPGGFTNRYPGAPKLGFRPRRSVRNQVSDFGADMYGARLWSHTKKFRPGRDHRPCGRCGQRAEQGTKEPDCICAKSLDVLKSNDQ